MNKQMQLKLFLAITVLSLLITLASFCVSSWPNLFAKPMSWLATFALTFFLLYCAHLFFGESYVSWQPNAVHRQYNILWANGV